MSSVYVDMASFVMLACVQSM